MDQESLQKLKALEALRSDLQATITEINRKRTVAHTWGWVLVGVGAASAGLAGTCYYLAEQAYANYKTSTDDDLAAEYRAQVTMWDTLTLVSAGTGVVSIGISIPFFVRRSQQPGEKKELKRIEAEMSAMQDSRGRRNEEGQSVRDCSPGHVGFGFHSGSGRD